MARVIAGVMGPGGDADAGACAAAARLGELIADEGWVLLTGGLARGVMDAALAGAKRRGGLTVGILPDADARSASPAADIRIVTGLGQARNIINVLSSDVLFVCGTSSGTASEVALALRTGREIILVNASRTSKDFWDSLGGRLHYAGTAEEAVALARRLLGSGS